MTPDKKKIVRMTWKLLRGIDPEVVGDVFYGKLFSDQPGLRRMFPSDMSIQYQKLVDMLNFIISRLDQEEEWHASLQAMGQRHFQYGVKAQHYTAVGQALLWTLQKGLGPDWNEEVKDAWNQCYSEVAEAMMSRIP